MKGNRKGCGRTGNGRDTKGGNEGDGVNKETDVFRERRKIKVKEL